MTLKSPGFYGALCSNSVRTAKKLIEAEHSAYHGLQFKSTGSHFPIRDKMPIRTCSGPLTRTLALTPTFTIYRTSPTRP